MDTSPEFVQMCRQAKEIQEQWKRELGDFCYIPPYSNCPTTGTLIYDGDELFPSDTIFFPRQDQLQAMIFKKSALSLACCFKDYIVRPMFDELMPNRKERMAFMVKASMEQMWLCYVMVILYNKQWNGSDWVAE